MTYLIDGDRFEAWLRDMQSNLRESARERHEADGPEDPTALRMDGGVANLFIVINNLRNFEAGTQRTPMEDIQAPTHTLVRSHARGTSWEAALGVTAEGRRRMYAAIYRLLSRLGPMTDHEIRDAMVARNFQHSWSGLSARRVELERAGWVRDTGEKRLTQFGKNATVWAAVPEEL